MLSVYVSIFPIIVQMLIIRKESYNTLSILIKCSYLYFFLFCLFYLKDENKYECTVSVLSLRRTVCCKNIFAQQEVDRRENKPGPKN